MKKFLFVFRGDYQSMPKESAEEMLATTQKWMNWFKDIAAQSKFAGGNHLDVSGKTVKSGGVISDGPYTEIKESIMGYTLIKATSVEEAAALVKDCPILSFGGNVEIRGIADRDFSQEDGKEFLLVFRGDYNAMPKESPEGMQAATQKWMNWVAGIAVQNKLVDRGNRLTDSGKVLRGDTISDGPYAEIKESIMGYTLINAISMEDAIGLAKGAPILSFGSVEVREISEL
ncbi:YciI family protein [Olivibacter ginsenosidimutans]|uniref:YciI family protein n=1 Tax=Olivibacter ginsenosidimutans TaxID=1176537 RepID=A0ABP9BFP4_9SPHI